MEIVTGIKKIDKKLRTLADKEAKKVARSGLRKGMTVMAKAMRAAVPAAKTKGHSSARIKKSIRTRFLGGSKKREPAAKVGIDVGQKKAARYAPHAHLIALGTKERHQGIKLEWKGGVRHITRTGNRIRRTGRVRPNPFIRRAAASSAADALKKMESAILAGIEKAASK